MDVFFELSKHCRCSFNSLSNRFMSEKQKWIRNDKTNRSGLPKIVRCILHRKWKVNVLNTYFRKRRKIRKAKISRPKKSISKSDFEEKTHKITVNNVCTDLPIPDSYRNDEAWRSVFVDLTKKGSMTYLIFVDQRTLYPEVFELGVRSLWKETKHAFRDVFREYRIPAEIHTSQKLFFCSGKFVRFMKDHGIITTTKSDVGNHLTYVVASVKVLIHNSRFWHEELRKLREAISKRLLATVDKYVQVSDLSEADMKFSMSGSSSENSSEARNDALHSSIRNNNNNNPKTVPTVKDKQVIKPILLTKRKQIIDKKDANVDLVTLNEKELGWIDCLRNIHLKTCNCQKNRFVNNISKKTNGIVFDKNRYRSIEMPLTQNTTKIHHCAFEQNFVPISGIWNRTKNKLKKEINCYYRNHICNSTYQEEMLHYLSSYRIHENDRRNEVVLKFGLNGSGDNCSINAHVSTNKNGQTNNLTSIDNFLKRFPIEILPYKYDNLFITQKDLNWKAVVMDVIEHSSRCYCLFIDCATKLSELFLSTHKKRNVNTNFLINGLCQLWQIHGKPIEIHSPKGNTFSCPQLRRFIEKYDMIFYYDSPFLRNDMKLGQIWMRYRNNLRKGNIYTELLRIQQKIGKITKQRDKREVENKRQKTLFSLNNTTINDTMGNLVTRTDKGILQKETIDFTQVISWKKIIVDVIYYNHNYYMIFIDIETLYPEIKEIQHVSKLHWGRIFIRAFRNFFKEKSIPEEIHAAGRRPFNIKGIVRFMDRIGVNYYIQSSYFNGGNCVYKCLEHMKLLISQSEDVNLAIYNCKKKPIPWLGLSPQQMAHYNRKKLLSDRVVHPWAEIIIDLFSDGDICFLIVFDYDSLFPECFQLDRNVFTNASVRIVRACEQAFSVLGCPKSLWTFDRAFSRSTLFLKFLQIRGIRQYYLSSQKERETSSMLASLRKKLTTTSSFNSALVSTREAYNRFIDACPTRRLREKETAVSEEFQAANHRRKHVRFNLHESSLNDLDLSDSDEN